MKIKPLHAGFVTAVCGAALFFLYTRRFETETAGGQRVEVLVSTRRIERGVPITEELLTTRSIPQAYVDDRAVRAGEREKIIGLKAAEIVGVSQTVLWSDVVTTRDDKRDLSSLVQPGYRAVTAPFTANPAFTLIHPGDFVDVLSVVRRDNSEARDSIVLLQRVLVLATGIETSHGRSTEKPKNGAASPPVLTLSLNVQEAQLLSLAAQRGALSVALRNPNDQRVLDNVPDIDSGALDEPGQRERVRNVRRYETTSPRGPIRLGARQ
ncbi:MAG: Flp pilus assembly protein CpaB [Polyangiaceae bacterium]|jgi:pilus assembly protein CpaB|nr:Flp pilus assembly protein CpaB [Polyangiaceae bacterium]